MRLMSSSNAAAAGDNEAVAEKLFSADAESSVAGDTTTAAAADAPGVDVIASTSCPLQLLSNTHKQNA